MAEIKLKQRRGWRHLTKAQAEERLWWMQRMREKGGCSDTQIAATVDLTRERVAQILGRRGWQKRYETERQLVASEYAREVRPATEVGRRLGMPARRVARYVQDIYGEGVFEVRKKAEEASARSRLMAWVKQHSGLVITHTNLARTNGTGFAAGIERSKVLSQWRQEFGQPVKLGGQTRRKDGYIYLVED